MSYLRLLPLLFSMSAFAMPIQTQMLKPRAFFVEGENNLFEPLDLKAKTLLLKNADFDQCGTNLVRKAQTLTYSCTLPIVNHAKISRIQSLVTPDRFEVVYGGSKRTVYVQVSPDARSLNLTTAFDSIGIDFEVSRFNDDFFLVYATTAKNVISEALRKQPIRLQVLESR